VAFDSASHGLYILLPGRSGGMVLLRYAPSRPRMPRPLSLLAQPTSSPPGIFPGSVASPWLPALAVRSSAHPARRSARGHLLAVKIRASVPTSISAAPLTPPPERLCCSPSSSPPLGSRTTTQATTTSASMESTDPLPSALAQRCPPPPFLHFSSSDTISASPLCRLPPRSGRLAAAPGGGPLPAPIDASAFSLPPPRPAPPYDQQPPPPRPDRGQCRR